MKDIILLIDDDPEQSESIASAIRRRYPNAEVTLVETESEFYGHLEKIPVEGPRPHMVICDVMLPWAFPEPDAAPPPPAVAKGTFRKAGLRCWRRFRARADLRSVPWIYFTVLDEKTIDFENNRDDRTGYAQKTGTIEALFEGIEEWSETDEQVTRILMESPKMRRILLEGLQLPLGDCVSSLA